MFCHFKQILNINHKTNLTVSTVLLLHYNNCINGIYFITEIYDLSIEKEY